MIRRSGILNEVIVKNETELEKCGRALATTLKPGNVVFLEGSIGAGKTTVARGILRGFGYRGIAVSPTYTLMEAYDLGRSRIVHMDLYRVERPQDLDAIGIRDYLDGQTIFLIEWPDQMIAFLPAPDLRILLSTVPEGRKVQTESMHVRSRITN